MSRCAPAGDGFPTAGIYGLGQGAAAPSMLVVAASYLAMPLATAVSTLAVLAVVIGIGNGMGNGVIMTLGTDARSPDTRAEFLGARRITHDIGMFAGPLRLTFRFDCSPIEIRTDRQDTRNSSRFNLRNRADSLQHSIEGCIPVRRFRVLRTR